jgi:hypothetical protein
MWLHWEYGCDIEFLRKRAYPFFKEVAAFYEDYIFEGPNGEMLIAPSQSPENRFVAPEPPTPDAERIAQSSIPEELAAAINKGPLHIASIGINSAMDLSLARWILIGAGGQRV